MAKLVGILNITPDSFSDGGKYFTPENAVEAAYKIAEDGADMIDIGAESTRPNATPISPNEEWQRLSPVLAGLKNFPLPISIDTRHPQTAAKALEQGACWINDVSGFANPAMIDAVRNSDCTIVIMHSLTVPANPAITLPPDADVVETLIEWAEQRFSTLEKSGISRTRMIFDVGIGFGKTPTQSRIILERIKEFDVLGVPLLVGHSRKSFLGDVDRDAATLALSQTLAQQGVSFLRVHDVKSHKERL